MYCILVSCLGTRICCKFRNYDKSDQSSAHFRTFIMCFIFSEYWVLVLCVDTIFRYGISIMCSVLSQIKELSAKLSMDTHSAQEGNL